jgi:hypothetical protein
VPAVLPLALIPVKSQRPRMRLRLWHCQQKQLLQLCELSTPPTAACTLGCPDLLGMSCSCSLVPSDHS